MASDDGGEVVVGHPHEQPVAGDAGVGDQDLDRARAPPRPRSNAASTEAVSVTSQRHPGQRPSRRLAGAVGDGDPVAAGQRRPRDGQPDAAVAAGDQRRCAVRPRGRRYRLDRPPDAHAPRRPAAAARPRVGSAAVRAIQITEFGGPEVLELVDLPDPEPAERHAPARRRRGRRQLRRHPPGRGQLPRPADAPVRPGRRGRRPRRRRPAGRRAAVRRRVRRAGARPPGDDLRAARRGRRPHRAGLRPAGHDGLAPAADQRPPARRARRSSCTSGAGGVGSLAVQLARELGRRPGDRDRVHRRTSATWRATSAPTSRSTSPGRTPTAVDLRDARSRPTTAGRSTSCWR